MNDCVTKSTLGSVKGCQHLRNDGIMCAIDVVISGKGARVCDYDDVGKDYVFANRDIGARVFVSVWAVICTLQAISTSSPWTHEGDENNAMVGNVTSDMLKTRRTGLGWRTLVQCLVCGVLHSLSSVPSAVAARHNVRELELACQVSLGHWTQVETPSPMQLGTVARVVELLKLKQPMPGDAVIAAKPRCRNESEKMSQSAFGCCASPTCAATFSEIEQSYMRV